MADSHRVRGLQGGAKLITAPMPERLSASLVFMFGGGSRLEDDRLAGVSHFIEHLFFKGTRRRPTSKEIADAIEGVGGFINASTDKELTAYWARVPAEHLELGLDVLFDVVSNSKLTLEDVERERMVILEELKGYQDQPQDYVLNLLRARTGRALRCGLELQAHARRRREGADGDSRRAQGLSGSAAGLRAQSA